MGNEAFQNASFGKPRLVTGTRITVASERSLIVISTSNISLLLLAVIFLNTGGPPVTPPPVTPNSV